MVCDLSKSPQVQNLQQLVEILKQLGYTQRIGAVAIGFVSEYINRMMSLFTIEPALPLYQHPPFLQRLRRMAIGYRTGDSVRAAHETGLSLNLIHAATPQHTSEENQFSWLSNDPQLKAMDKAFRIWQATMDQIERELPVHPNIIAAIKRLEFGKPIPESNASVVLEFAYDMLYRPAMLGQNYSPVRDLFPNDKKFVEFAAWCAYQGALKFGHLADKLPGTPFGQPLDD